MNFIEKTSLFAINITNRAGTAAARQLKKATSEEAKARRAEAARLGREGRNCSEIEGWVKTDNPKLRNHPKLRFVNNK